MTACTRLPLRFLAPALLSLALALFSFPAAAPAQTDSTAFRQAVATAAARDKDIAAFYKSNGYNSIWTGKGSDRKRREALLDALSAAGTITPEPPEGEGEAAQLGDTP